MDNSLDFAPVCFLVLWMYWSCASVFYYRMGYFPPSITRAAMTHMFWKDPSLTTIAVPAWIDLEMCLSIVSEAWCLGFHVSGTGVVV